MLFAPTAMLFTLLALILIEFYMDAKEKSFIRFRQFTIHAPSTYLNKLSDRSAKFQLAIYNKLLSWDLKHKCAILYNASTNVIRSVFYVVFPHLREVDLMYYLELILNDDTKDPSKTPDGKSPPVVIPSAPYRLSKRPMYARHNGIAKKLDFDEAKSPSDNKSESSGVTWVRDNNMLVNRDD